LLGLGINLAVIVPWYAQSENRIEDSDESVKILISNVAMNRINHHKLAQLVENEQPDIIGLIEVSPQVLEDLAINPDDYRFRFEFPTKENNEGLALFSKLPIAKANTVMFGESATATIVATIHTGQSAVEFILTHPYWPLGVDLAGRRNMQLQHMAEYVQASGKTVLLAGDLNTTMWSAYYREFEKNSGLVNARIGYGIGPTWPSSSLLGIPIDHIMITMPSQIGDFQVHKGIGSDHLPITARVTFPTNHSERQMSVGSNR
jgi:endonuclease/exonuclease/phosphatase (EEP) superfamily protein YafD